MVTGTVHCGAAGAEAAADDDDHLPAAAAAARRAAAALAATWAAAAVGSRCGGQPLRWAAAAVWAAAARLGQRAGGSSESTTLNSTRRPMAVKAEGSCVRPLVQDIYETAGLPPHPSLSVPAGPLVLYASAAPHRDVRVNVSNQHCSNKGHRARRGAATEARAGRGARAEGLTGVPTESDRRQNRPFFFHAPLCGIGGRVRPATPGTPSGAAGV